MILSIRSTLVAGALVASAASAFAADLPARIAAPAPAPVLVADFFDPWMIRVRAIGVLPVSSGDVTVGGAFQPTMGLKVSNSVVPELDITYFFTKNIAVEAICCVTPHSIKGTGALDGAKIGSTLLFPPTVTLQYHFTDFGAFKPYVGVGVNWTHYFDNKAENPTFARLEVKDSVGIAAQVGFDYMITRNWGVNVDVKRVMMRPDANVTLAPATAVSAKVKIDPWIVGAGLTYRFGGGSNAVLARY